MRIMTSVLFLLLLLCCQAQAEPADDDYINQFFGTQVQLKTAERPYDYESGGWWADKLPDQLMYDNSYIAGMVNAGRIANGETRLLDSAASIVSIGYEDETADGFMYDISFRGMRPSEVQIVFSALGGVESLLPGASAEFLPLRTADFNYYGSTVEEPITIAVGERSLVLAMDMPASELHATLLDMFSAAYGQAVQIDIYYNQSVSAYGSWVDLSITAAILDQQGSGNAPQF